MKTILHMLLITFLSIFFVQNINAQEVIVTDDANYTSPASGAILDVKSTTMGFMAPRVALTATNAASPLTLPSTGLLVYNTATTTAGTLYDVTPGFYYNAGTPAEPNWVQVVNATGVGTADMWDDLRVPLSEPSTGNVQPDWAKFPYNSTPSDENPFLNWFKASGTDEMYFVVQLPHDWDEGTDIYPHVHWVPSENGNETDNVTWVLQYSWLNIGETHTEYLTATASSTKPSETFVANRQYVTSLGSGMDGSGKLISSMIVCRLYRDGSAGSDTYNGLAGALEIDFHYQKNSFGSRLQFEK